MEGSDSLNPTRLTNKAVVTVDGLGAAVRPGILYTAPGGSIQLNNQSGGVIDVFLTGGGAPQVLTIPATEIGSLTPAAPEGIYVYAVYSHATGDFARGNSSPRVIIK